MSSNREVEQSGTKRYAEREAGVTAVEYAIALGMIGLLLVIGVTSYRDAAENALKNPGMQELGPCGGLLRGQECK